jgi:hypothetical protein
MTPRDWKLLKKAHDTKAIDNQLVEKMIPLADTEECRELLKFQYHDLYAREEEMAGLL